jgi:hypothetical protein
MVAELDTDIKQKMTALKKAMSEAADGKILKRELSKELRELLNPVVARQRAKVLALPSKGGHTQGMRQAIARQTKAATRWSGRNMGVQVIQRARAMPRNFQMAGRMFNRDEGWNPTSLGGETRHQQVRPTEWFDSETNDVRAKALHQVHQALERTAVKIGQSVHESGGRD